LSYLKFSADKIFDGYRFHENAVLIVNENGTIDSIVSANEAGEDIQHFKGIITPGFVNAHCHLELSHMKGHIPEKTGLIDFVFNIVTQRNKFTEEQIAEAIEKAEQEILQSGTVAVGDICNNASTVQQKQKGNITYYNFVEVTGWLPQIAKQRFATSLEVFNQFNIQHSTFKNCLVPHAPYSVSEVLWHLLAQQFSGKTTPIHNQETAFEDDLFTTKSGDFIRMFELMHLDNSFFKPSGKSSIQTYFHHFQNAQNILLVHNTFINEADILFVKEAAAKNKQTAYFCLCVNANLYIENSLPPVELISKHTGNIVLGTDSLASNRSLNMLDELKTIMQNFSFLTTEQLLQWATINGAKALQFDEQLGSFEKGKHPGVNLLEHLENGKITTNTTVRKLL
jgi:cytosine/adenosine deaminase-related metal-dependent hydrolase